MRQVSAMTTVQQRVTHCFSNVFPNLTREEIERASVASSEGWDSVAHVTLLTSIEEEFELQFGMEDFEQLVSYQQIVDYLQCRSLSK